jgi:hypothetical protein
VAQSARRPRFAPETLDELQTLHKFRRDDLQRHGTFRADVRRQINSSHSAFADFCFDFIFAVERLPNEVSTVHIFFANLKKVVQLFTLEMEISLKNESLL